VTNENEAEEPTMSLCLRAVTELDPNALARILGFFQNLNIIPRRVIAERGTGDTLYIRIDVTGLTEDRLTLIAAKTAQLTGVAQAHWHRL
jgi:hypothetical protein